jgi:hypothetical protein
MKSTVIIILLLSLSQVTFSQTSDFIVLKKRNNRTLKTYYPGAFISAVTYHGFEINGYIKSIRNDSLIIRQEELRLMPAGVGGTKVDTFVYTVGFDYREIEKFNYTSQYTWGRKKGFAVVTLPKLMMIGGTGYVLLELINTAYRRESLNDDGKLLSMGIGVAVAVAGYTINRVSKEHNRVGKKYKVVYVRNSE